MSESDGALLRIVLATPAPGAAPAPPPDRVGAAKDVLAILAAEIQSLLPALRLCPGGDQVSPQTRPLAQQMETVGNDGDKAEAIVAQVRIHVADAYAKRDAEDARRRDALLALHAQTSPARSQMDAIRPALPLLPEATQAGLGLQPGFDTLATALADRNLALLGPDAAAFDAAMAAATNAGATWNAAAVRATAAVEAERSARTGTIRDLTARTAQASAALAQSIEHSKQAFPAGPAEAEAAAKHQKAMDDRRKAFGKAVPGWDGGPALQATLVEALPSVLLPHADFARAAAARERDCAAAEEIAARATAWTDNFMQLRPAGVAAMKKASTFGAKVPAAKKELDAATLAIGKAISLSEFAEARSRVAALEQTVAALDALQARADISPAAAALVAAATKRILGQLQDARAAPQDEAAALDAAFGKAEAIQDRLNACVKSFEQQRPKLAGDLRPLAEKLAALAPKVVPAPPGIAELAGSPLALANATNFLAAFDNLRSLTGRHDDLQVAIGFFRARHSPATEALDQEKAAILAKADPQTDVGYADTIRALREFTARVDEAIAKRAGNLQARTALEDRTKKTLGAATKYGTEILALIGEVSLDTGADCAKRFIEIGRLVDGVSANAGALKAVLAEADTLGPPGFGLVARVALRNRAEAAIAGQITGGSPDAPPEIEQLRQATAFLKQFQPKWRAAEPTIQDASKRNSPGELVTQLKALDLKARQSAENLEAAAGMVDVAAAQALASAIEASTHQFADLEALIEHGLPEQKAALPARYEAGVKLGATWAGGGGEFSAQLARIIGDLNAEVTKAFAAERTKRKPADIARQRGEIVTTFATLENPPAPPDDPAPEIARIDAMVPNNQLKAAFQDLTRVFDPLAAKITTLHPLLPEIAGFQADWAAMLATYTAAHGNAHKDQQKELETLKADAVAIRVTNPVQGRVLLAKLPPRITAIGNQGTGWKGPPPRSLAASKTTNHATPAALKTEAAGLIREGGLTPNAVRSLIPTAAANGGAAVANTYAASTKYPAGFKYSWTAADGKTLTIYGHGPSNGPGVDASAISAQGNIVRIMVDGLYLQSDGSTTALATTDAGHIPLFGNP